MNQSLINERDEQNRYLYNHGSRDKTNSLADIRETANFATKNRTSLRQTRRNLEDSNRRTNCSSMPVQKQILSRSSDHYQDTYDAVPEDEQDIYSSSSRDDQTRNDDEDDYPMENH